ncbi:hypothetical protein [Haliangium ochraceum]|uniref:Lipoprotein n=1 Tax=Haliangium ochraceum (strain DSM 14365 / JCM 11303 / SMP-2) TaxID=502025 RepID=D0LUI8_HALO1|nr:hypothetical protein [Haliangium ochraceum]ACY19311.1 hypothetical protein Hoch_6847 [Haliangium ochraceum DSM 14365]
MPALLRNSAKRSAWILGAAATLLSAGCAQILGIEGLSGQSGDGGPTPGDGGGPFDAGPIDAPIDSGLNLSCAEDELSEGVGVFEFDTTAAGNEFSATCGGGDSPDQMLRWRAPVTDYYVFDTFASEYDTVLALFDECGGNELSCSNNIGQTVQSELVRKFEQGQEALILLDGAVGDSGTATLNIERVTCPDADLEGQTFPVQLSTVGFGDDFAGACGGAGHEDRGYNWVAPADGLYYFRATSETFTPVLSVVDGGRCSDLELGCNAAQTGRFGAEVVRFVRAGQPVSVLVDGRDGAGLFDLDIGLQDGPSCPEEPLPDDDTLEIALNERSLAPSCSFARHGNNFGEETEAPDRTFSFAVPSIQPPAGGGCEVTITANLPFVLYALEGSDCGGAEVDCRFSDTDPNGDHVATVGFTMQTEETEFVVVVAGHPNNFNNADLLFSAELGCFAVAQQPESKPE